MEYNSYRSGVPDQNSLYWPLLLLIAALIIWFSFQLIQAFKLRENMATIYNNQETMMQSSNRIRQMTDSLATGALQLSKQGNANATLVVNALAKRGININQPPQPNQDKQSQGQENKPAPNP